MTTLAPLYGLLLAGGSSSRMGRDKASLRLGEDGRTQAAKAVGLLEPLCARVFLSLREGQTAPAGCEHLEIVRDRGELSGPLAGILAAIRHAPDAAWLVLACDLPFLSSPVLGALLAERTRGGGRSPFIAYAASEDGLPEPLCAIYEPQAGATVAAYAARGEYSPRHIMRDEHATLLVLPAEARDALENVNTPRELALARERLGTRSSTP